MFFIELEEVEDGRRNWGFSWYAYVISLRSLATGFQLPHSPRTRLSAHSRSGNLLSNHGSPSLEFRT